MKTAKLSVLALLLTLCSTGAALAGGYGHGGYGGHGHGHVSVGIGIGVGVPIYGPRYYGAPYYPYPYYSPAYYPAYYPVAPVVVSQPVVYPQSQVYIEQGQSQQPEVQPQDNSPYWYYCGASKTYYPYVRSCASGWEQVTPQPPR